MEGLRKRTSGLGFGRRFQVTNFVTSWILVPGEKNLRFKVVRDLPRGPVAKTLHSQFRGPGVRSLVRELDSTCCN